MIMSKILVIYVVSQDSHFQATVAETDTDTSSGVLNNINIPAVGLNLLLTFSTYSFELSK
jgi:hypothetical protein